MDLLNFIGENLGWVFCLFVVLAWAIKEKLTHTVQAVIEQPNAEIKRPQLIVTINVYEGNKATIIATDAENRNYADIPVEAVREASTVLQGVEVEVPRTVVDEGLDEVFVEKKEDTTTKKSKSHFQRVVDSVNQKE